MFYALIDMRGSCSATTSLTWGKTLKQVARLIVSECEMLIDDTCELDDLTAEELEEEYYCEFDDYRALEACASPTPQMIKSFQFVLGDCTVDIGCLVEGYDALVEAFAKYTEDKMTLDAWRLIPKIEETDLNLSRIDSELRLLNDDFARNEFKFFVEK